MGRKGEAPALLGLDAVVFKVEVRILPDGDTFIQPQPCMIIHHVKFWDHRVIDNNKTFRSLAIFFNLRKKMQNFVMIKVFTCWN